jgi:NitT/TauT family transport system substrate-binding protein
MRKFIFILITLMVVVIALGGIYLYLKPKPLLSSKYTGPVEKLNLSLKWIHQAQFAGHYVALEKGFYRDAGFDVNLIPFGKGDAPITAVTKGTSAFGLSGADEIILARSKGIPVRAIAVIYKINPVAAYSLKESGITKPQQFIGKTVGIERADDGSDVNVGYIYYAMMAKLGIDRSKVKEISIGFDDKELLAGKTDVSTGYIINEPNLVKEKRGAVNTILMADYGVNLYADVLFTSEDTIKNKPDMVKRFLEATLRGWQYAIENEEEAVDDVMKYATDTTREHQVNMLISSVPLINVGGTRLGWMEATSWDQAQKLMVQEKLLSKPITITEAYTMEFLQSVYGK